MQGGGGERVGNGIARIRSRIILIGSVNNDGRYIPAMLSGETCVLTISGCDRRLGGIAAADGQDEVNEMRSARCSRRAKAKACSERCWS